VKYKIKRFLFILKGKTIGWLPSSEKDFKNYQKYIKGSDK
jgi:hypothetical protein